jgi:hypothetical protein
MKKRLIALWTQTLLLLFYATLVALNARATDGELVKNNSIEVISVLDASNSKPQRVVIKIPISSHTTERRIFQITDNFQKKSAESF